jgi:hypothetical protein
MEIIERMETKEYLLTPLFEKAEGYSKISLKLIKLKFVDKASDLLSSLMSRLILSVAVALFLITFNIAIGFWLGDILGKTYFGFLALASFYGAAAIVLLIIRPYIQEKIAGVLIKKSLN